MDKNKIIEEFNSLNIANMPAVTELFELKGEFINLEYDMPSCKVKLLDNEATYLGAQLEQIGSDRCFGLIASDEFLIVCTYGAYGSDPQLILYKKR